MLIARIILIFTLLSSTSFAVAAGQPAEKNDADFSRIYDLFSKKNYEEALEIITTVLRDSDDKNPKWDYIEGVCLYRLGRYEEAEAKLNSYVQKEDASARGHYFLGQISFYKGDYQKALNSFQVSQDLSRDTALDKLLDLQIDRSIRFRDYYDNHKPGSFAMFVGYEAHKNVLGLSPDSVDKNLEGNIFSYGISVGYRPVDKINFVFEPTVLVIDRYTLDKSFKGDSTLQSLDALQGLVSLPITFYLGNNNSTQYNLSLNGYSSYLPINSTNRELYLSSIFLKGRVLIDLSQKLSTDISLVAASDKGYNFASDDDDSTGPRSELTLILKHFLNQDRTRILTYGLGGVVKNASGINSRYQKGSASVGYQTPSFWETVSSFDLRYDYLTYPDKVTPRKDNKTTFIYTLMQPLTASMSLSYNIGAEANSSDVDLYKYNDYYAGIQFNLSAGF